MTNPMTLVRDWKKQRDERPKELSLLFGEQDTTDLFSYAGLEEQADYLCIDGTYVRTLFISGYPFVANSGWLDSLVNFNHDVDITHHIHEVNALQALPKLHRKITELESTKRQMIRSGKIVGSEITDPLDSAMELRDKIQRGQEKLFQVSISVALRAKTLLELDKITKMLETTLSARLFYTKVARYQQLEALQTVLPRGEDQLSQKRNLDSSSAALTFPFMSSELVHESGILYGVNNSNNSLVILDRFSLHNANSITFAQSGSGKSYTTKVEILRQLMHGTKVIVIDPEREYEYLAEAVGGRYFNVSLNSDHHINPFDLAIPREDETGADVLRQNVINLVGLFRIMLGGLSPEEDAIIDRAITKLTFHSTVEEDPQMMFNIAQFYYGKQEMKHEIGRAHV